MDIRGLGIKSGQLFFSRNIDRSWRNMKVYKWKWMLLDALGWMHTADFEKENTKLYIAYHLHYLTSVSTCGTVSMEFYANEDFPLKSYGWSVFLCLCPPVTQAVSIPFCTTLDLQLSFYRPLCYNSRAHCPRLQCLCTTTAILADANSYFMVSSFKCEGKCRCHDLIPNHRISLCCWGNSLSLKIKARLFKHDWLINRYAACKAAPDLWKRRLLKYFITMVFTCHLFSWCKVSSPLRGNNNVVVFPFPFHVFMPLANLWFIHLQG